MHRGVGNAIISKPMFGVRCYGMTAIPIVVPWVVFQNSLILMGVGIAPFARKRAAHEQLEQLKARKKRRV